MSDVILSLDVVCVASTIDNIRKHGLETRIKIFRLFSLWCASCQNVGRLFTGRLFSSVDISFTLSVRCVMY